MADKNKYLMKHFETGEVFEIPADAVERVSLERQGGQPIPVTNGGYTQINNYLLHFWSPILGAGPFTLYLHLISRAFGDKETVWPRRALLAAECQISISTLNRFVQVLENHYLVWRITVVKPDGEKDPTIYVIRRNVPFLTKEEYDSLPDILKKEHDKYMDRLEKSGFIEIPNYGTEDYPLRTAKERMRIPGITDRNP